MGSQRNPEVGGSVRIPINNLGTDAATITTRTLWMMEKYSSSPFHPEKGQRGIVTGTADPVSWRKTEPMDLTHFEASARSS